MASSTRFRSVAAMASSVRGTNMRRLSTEPISSLPVALPSTRIELCRARAGRSVNRMTWSPRSSLTLPMRVISAPVGKTVTASMREVPLMSAACAAETIAGNTTQCESGTHASSSSLAGPAGTWPDNPVEARSTSVAAFVSQL